MSLAAPSKKAHTHWSVAQPWHTNAALLLIGFGLIYFTRQLIAEYDSYDIGNAAVAAGSLALYLAAAFLLLLKPASSNRYTLPIILAVGILCRLVCLFEVPFLSSDVYRYAWDGVVQHAHISPYRYVPGNPALSFLRQPNEELYANMNRRDYAHTIYPPVAQIAFYLITFISPTVFAMKYAMMLFEGLLTYGLVLLLRELGLRSEWVLLYAWCPLTIWEFGGSGHLDAMVMALIIFALLFRYRQQPVLTGLFLGLAIFTKFYPVVLFPALYQRKPDGSLDFRMPAAIAAIGLVSYSFYLSAGKLVFGFLGGYVAEEGMADGTRYFPLEFIQHLPGLAGTSNTVYMAFAATIMLALVAWAWRAAVAPGSRPAAFLTPAMSLAFAMMLIFSPHYPWYVAWLIPFLVLCPSLTVLTYVCAFQYLCYTALAVGSGPKQFQLNEILYATVLIAAVLECALYRVPTSRRWIRAHLPYAFAYPTLEQVS